VVAQLASRTRVDEAPSPAAATRHGLAAIAARSRRPPPSLALLGAPSPHPAPETDSPTPIDTPTALNRALVTPSHFPSYLAAGRRRRNPPIPAIPRRIRAYGSLSLVPPATPVYSPSLEPPRIAPANAVAVRRRMPAPPSSSSRRPAWLPRRRHVGATSALTGPSRSAAPSLRLPSRARGPRQAVRLHVGPPIKINTYYIIPITYPLFPSTQQTLSLSLFSSLTPYPFFFLLP